MYHKSSTFEPNLYSDLPTL